MSDIMRRVITLFEVRGANQVNAQLGQMRSGMGGYRNEIRQTSRQHSILNDQVRALGTTLRYAFAGSAIFGIVSMVRSLGEFQGRLGEISSIATSSGGIPIVGRQLDQLGDDLLAVSNRTAQPIDDLEQGVLSLYSTIGDVPPNEAARIMEEISKVAVTSQSNIEDTTQALLGQINAFGQNTDAIKQYGDEFYRVIKLSAGMPGHVYAQQLGRLSASASIGQFSAEQMGGLAVASTRFGGSPAVNQRGLAQLMLYLMNPRGKEAQQTLAGLGLDQQTRIRIGGYATLKRVLTAINERGGVGVSPALGGATEDTLSVLDEQGLTGRAAGISGGGTTLLSKVTGRIESQRILAILSRLVTPDQVAGTKNQTIDQYIEAVKNGTSETDNFDAAMQRAMDRKRIQQATNAWHNMGIEIANAYGPIINPGARAITALSDAVGSADPRVRFGATAGLGAAAFGAYKLWGRSAFRAVPVVGAAMDAASGSKALGGSPLHPMYVYNVNSLFGGRPGLPGGPGLAGGRIPNRDLRTDPTELGRAGRTTTPIGGRWARAGTSLASLTGYGFVGAILSQAQQAIDGPPSTAISRAHGNRGYDLVFGAQNGQNRFLGYGVKGHPNEIIRDKKSQDAFLKKLDEGMTAQQAYVAVVGKANVQVDITQKDATGKTTHRKKVHATVDLFPQFTQPAPQRKGKNKTARSGQ